MPTSPHPARVLVLNDNSEQPNWGAQATPFSIRRMFADHYPEAQVDFLPYSWLAGRHYRLPFPFPEEFTFRERRFGPINPLVYWLARGHDPYPGIWDDFEFYADKWVAGQAGPVAADFVERVQGADAVVHNGENSLYRNTVPGMRALFLLWLAKTRFGKVACEVNHTAALADMTRPIMRGMAQRVLPLLDLVTVRESRSLADLRKLGVQNAELLPDVVFYLGSDFGLAGNGSNWSGASELGDAYFCLSASALPMSGPRDGAPGAIVELVERINDLQLRAVLVAKDPHCQYLREVATQTGGIFFGPEHQFAELWPLFRGAKFIITGHYHYAIIAAQVGCPFIPLSTNNHKMAGLAEHLNWHLREPFDATALRPLIDDIAAEARRLNADRQSYSSALKVRAAEMKKESAQHVVRLREIVNKARATARAT